MQILREAPGAPPGQMPAPADNNNQFSGGKMTGRKLTGRRLLAALLMGPATSWALDLGEITVTGTREETPKAETPASVESVDEEVIEFARPAHPSEIMGRISGVHVNVTNGEGHATAIRQPMTTGPMYLFLEDGIPTRSTGFFNHNALYEVNLPQAAGIEVTKGPGTSLYGSDAIGGIVNVITRPAPLEAEAEVNVELGENGWWRLLGSAGNSWGDDGLRADLNLTHTDGWRDGTEYDRQSATARWDRFLENGAALKTVFTASNIDQQTAGTSRLSEEDYLNNPTRNYHPISFRDVRAWRLSTAYEKEDADSLLSITPYVRSNTMEYMPNWSFGYDPNITETAHDSVGLQLKYRKDFEPRRTRLVVGMDIDYSPGSRLEHSIDAVRDADGIFTSYTLGEKIYDYDVTFFGISPYLHLETSLSERARLTAGLRYDHIEYDYENNMADGLLRLIPPPTSMGFPPSYNHPADTTVTFSHLSPKLGLTYAFRPDLNGFISWRHAFRAPSEGALFRPGSSQASLDLKPIKVDSYETGLRGRRGGLQYEVSLYYMTKEDDLVTFEADNGDRFTVNAGETLHRGIELSAGMQLAPAWLLNVSYSYAKHTFEEWVESGTVYSGNEMPSAPREIGNVRLAYAPGALKGGRVELEWERLGSYWMDSANTEKYDGHDLLNLRASYPISDTVELYGRVMNLTDERYATAASLSRGARELAPGMPRTFFAGINARF